MKKKIIIAGGTGLIGSRLVELLDPEQYEIKILTRSSRSSNGRIQYIQWDTKSEKLDKQDLESAFAIINLAGAGIADERWTDSRKMQITDSRTSAAKTLEKALSGLNTRPDVYIGASAVGYYGDRSDEILKEDAHAGSGFLAEVCQQWEDAHQKIESLVSRHCILRIGIVLSTKGGALKEILNAAKTGVYGYFGNGRAYYPWIHIDDLCSMIITALENKDISGVYNAVGPDPIPIKQLVVSVKHAKNSPGLVMPVPVFALRVIMGEMANMLIASMRAVPEKIMQTGFSFKWSNAEEAIRDLVQRRL